MHIELIHVPTTGWSLHTTHSKYNNVEKCNFLLIKAQWFYKKFVEKSKLITNTNEPTVVTNALNPRTKNIAWLHETNFMTKLVQLLSSMLWNTTTIFFISVYIYSDIKCATISIHKLRLTHRLPTFYIVAADVSLSSWCNAVSAMKTNEHTSHIIWRATYRRKTRTAIIVIAVKYKPSLFQIIQNKKSAHIIIRLKLPPRGLHANDRHNNDHRCNDLHCFRFTVTSFNTYK